MRHTFLTLALLSASALPALAQDNSERPIAAPSQDHCITVMAGFPNDDMVPRYQFFKLTQDLAQDATPEFRTALDHFGGETIPADTPVMDVIEDIANPVLRQAAPEYAISNTAHLIDFADRCEPFVSGQIQSLIAADETLAHPEFNAVINEDALFLRQVLSEALSRLGAEEHPQYGYAVQQYAGSLVTTRDNIEFATYSADIGDIEALYMEDLDGRLARSNDIINKEMDREMLGDAVTLSDDMNQAAKQEHDRTTLRTLAGILNRF